MALLGELASSILLFCLVFGMSATVEMKSLKKQVQNRMALCIGVLMQFVILPFVGFCVVKILNMPSTTGIILLVVTSSPGGSYSNWWCSLFNAELALSVTMTTISTLLSVVMLPTNLILYTRWTYSADVVKSLDWTGLIVSLIVVISGIGGGLYSSYRAEQRGNKARFHKTANRMGNVAGILLVTLSVLVSSTGKGDSDDSNNHKASLWDQDAKFYIGVALPAILGLFLAVKLASHYQLEKPERVAVAVEACYQNTGIATSVALTLYTGDELSTAIGVPLYYGIVEAVVLAIFCLVCWKRGWTKAPPDDNFCKVIGSSYEVHDEDDQGTEGAAAAAPGTEGGEQAPQQQQQPKREVRVELGSTDEESDDFVVGGQRRIPQQEQQDTLSETEMTQQSTVVAMENGTLDGPVAVIRATPSDDSAELGVDDEQQVLPKSTRLERFMATMRARASGYGFGIQDEERGLRSARGPVTLGLSQVASPPQVSRKQNKSPPPAPSSPPSSPTTTTSVAATARNSIATQRSNGGSNDEESGGEQQLPAQGRTID